MALLMQVISLAIELLTWRMLKSVCMCVYICTYICICINQTKIKPNAVERRLFFVPVSSFPRCKVGASGA